jgi:hypothetical protein
MDKFPSYIEAGLRHIFLGDDDQLHEAQSFLTQFEGKWGGVQDANLLMAISQGQENEIAFAIVALYSLDKERIHDVLVDLLESENMYKRWSSNMMLAIDKDRQALPHLCELLVECISNELFLHQNNNADYYMLNWSFSIPSLLSGYNNTSIAPIIRQSLEKCEKTYTYLQQNYGVIDDGVYYSAIGTVEYMQFLLLYLSGRLGAWGILVGITTAKSRLLQWLLVQSIASEHGKSLADDDEGPYTVTEQIRSILTEKFGLTFEEQQEVVLELSSNMLYQRSLTIESKKKW